MARALRTTLPTALIVFLALAVDAAAQIATGAVTGAVTDTSGGVLPGVNVSLTGERVLGGMQTQTTDATGAYRFDRLPPGAYSLKFELSGFKVVERTDIRNRLRFKDDAAWFGKDGGLHLGHAVSPMP